MTNRSLSFRFTSANVFPSELTASVVLSWIWQFSKCFYSPFSHAMTDIVRLSVVEQSNYKEDKKSTLTLAFKWRVIKSTGSDMILSSETVCKGWKKGLEVTLLWITVCVWHNMEKLLCFNLWYQQIKSLNLCIIADLLS